MTKGATYSELSKVTWIMYPFMLKIIIAPLVDFAFFKKLGKSRTYILIPGFIVSPRIPSILTYSL